MLPAIDLIVMRQNRTADETLIQIGKEIPRQVNSYPRQSPNEKRDSCRYNLSLKPISDNSSRTGAKSLGCVGIKIESHFPLFSSHAEEIHYY
jgi:hypothetical protein